MEHSIEFAPIPEAVYPDYKLEVIFKAFKWDPQVEDHNTVARQVMLLGQDTARQLAEWAEQLSTETMAMEEALVKRPDLAKELGLPRALRKAMPRMEKSYSRDGHVRLMRYDFHPTEDGWAVSEVNSDVPGGYAEASILPRLAARYFEGCGPAEDLSGRMVAAFQKRCTPGGNIAFVHATSYAEDSQIVQFMSGAFREAGYTTELAGPDLIRWRDGRAVSIAGGGERPVDGLVRYYPVEWLENLPRKARWKGAYDCETPSCNHPIVLLTQAKRLPLVWDRLGVPCETWKALLPETRDPRAVPKGTPGWIYKPNLGRVGQGISIEEAVTEKEKQGIQRAARRWPGNWVAQRRFKSQPFKNAEGEEHHLCVGVFTVDGRFAGFYARMSPYARIDANAKDVPVLVKGGWKDVL